MDRFKIGDVVTDKNVDSASAVGYLGCWRIVVEKQFDQQQKEWKYLTRPYNGTGFAWFYDHEL